ncbi:MAG TPA: AEC family transporter [bacterium]|nr:AEC family transporter [bacterium]
MQILNTVLPVFLVIALGWALGAGKLIDEEMNRKFSWFVFYVSAPALLFQGAARTTLSAALDLKTIGTVFGVSLATALIVYMAGARLKASRRGVVAQGSFRSNMVFVGLPVIQNALGKEVLGPAAVLIGFTVLLYNFLAVLVLALPHGNGGESGLDLKKTVRDVALNPLMLSSAAGLLFSAFDLHLPAAAGRAADMVGDIAAPLALVVVGASLDLKQLRHEIGPSLAVSLIKLVLYPAVIFAVLRFLGETGPDLEATVLLMAAPAAVASHIMAKEMKGDERLSSSVVIGTTVFSLFTITAWLAFLAWTK